MSSTTILTKKRKSNLRKKEEIEITEENHENDEIFQGLTNLNSSSLNDFHSDKFSTPKKEPSSISSSSCDNDENENMPPKKPRLINQATSSHPNTKIEEKCIIGINSTVIDNITIISNTQLGGGTVVIKNIIQSGLYVGNPQKFIR